MSRFSRRNFLQISGAATTGLMGNGLIRPAWASQLAPVAEEDAVVAFAHVGPIADEGWNWAHHQSMLAVKEAFPNLKNVIEVENVPYSADATRLFRQFVREGANIIFDTSSKGDFLLEVSDRTPDVAFCECNGITVKDNLSWYYGETWYPSYVIGVAAGLMTKTNKLGYIAAFPLPSAYASTNAFLMGARSVNPQAELQTIVINSWFDPQAATQAGTALLDNGCDFLFGIMDEAAYLQVAEARGAWAAMWNTDLRHYGPNAYVSSVVFDFKPYAVEQVRNRLNGTWKPAATLFPMGGGVDRDAWGQNVPAEVAAQADAVRDKILGGWSPFEGEIRDVNGEVRVAKGQTMTEDELYLWDWSVEGVSGLSS